MLKKIILTITALTAMAGLSYGLANPDWIGNVPGITFKTSTNVKLAYQHENVAAVQKYNVVSKHDSGDTYFGSSSVTTTLYKKKSGNDYLGDIMTLSDTQWTADLSTNGGESVWAGWSPM